MSDIKAVQAALGHADLRTTQRYLHATAERAATVALAVEERLSRHSEVGIVDAASDLRSAG